MSFLYSTKAILFENDIPLVLSSLGGPSDQQAGTCTSSTPSDRALRATGSAFREDNAEGLEMLLNAIKQIIRASHDVGQGQEASRTLQAQFPRAEHVPHVPVRETTGPQMQAYTMAFYQRAQAEKEEIRFSCHQVDYGTLPSFHAVYLYRGKEYSANGSSSKQAKHMASKNACDDLNIYIHA
ncbi:hypothetical protein C1H76_0655 [Elsinoe australis]|uniref:Uncharacterized protein n=1 Tax=Elsinoe australis TaxID=40998 RepID=A0A4U7B6R0_9PEZI|nr:hypothetical protein C1H76_0655 [Elsinoe australis]